MRTTYNDVIIAELMLKQQNAHNELVQQLKQAIGYYEDELEDYSEQQMAPHYFFTKNKDLIPRYVEFIYKHKYIEKKYKIKALESIHDETFDLSTISCTGNDFSPWADE